MVKVGRSDDNGGMEAIVTLKADPKEFDLLRDALNTHRNEQLWLLSEDAAKDPAVKRHARAVIVRIDDLLGKLK